MLSNYVKKLYHLFLELRKQFLSQIFIFPWFDNFFSFFYEFFHLTQRNWCIWFHEKKKLCIWYHFIKQNFQIHFVNVFFTHPLLMLWSSSTYTLPQSIKYQSRFWREKSLQNHENRKNWWKTFLAVTCQPVNLQGCYIPHWKELFIKNNFY